MPPDKPTPSSAYMRGEQMPLFFRWRPALRETNEDIRSAWQLATARTIDQLQNSGWLAPAAEKAMAAVVGPNGLQLNAKPNAMALGWTQDQANTWARAVETRFSMWTDSARACDAGARYTFAQLQGQAYRHWLASGEILATLPFIKGPGSLFGTKIKLLPAWRLSPRCESPSLINGVRVNAVGAPVAYVFKRQVPYGGVDEVELQATDQAGRPLVVHIFDGEPDQTRGISPFASVLKVCRQFDQLADATLTAATVQALFAAMFKSPGPSDEALAAMQESGENKSMTSLLGEKSEWYKRTDLNLGIHGKILHGFPGDELQFFRSEHPNSTYEPFSKFLLREICGAAAITYEEFTNDWAGATFSSSKMGTATNWPRVLYRRKHIVAPLCQRAYEAWLEEDIESGGTPFPGGVAGFLAQREAAAQANWRGPTMPQADELKTALAAAKQKEIGLPDSFVFETYGLDRDDVYEERKREQDRKDALGLKDPVAKAAAPPGADPSQDPTEDPSQDKTDTGNG